MGDRDIAEGPRLRRACPWGTPWPVPAEPLKMGGMKRYEPRRRLIDGKLHPAGMEQGGGGFPRGQVRCEDRPGSSGAIPPPS
jgi:hypothetical protein